MDRELGLVNDAITLVATGAAPRVVVAGLRFGRQLLKPVRRIAGARGVRIVPLWSRDGSAADIAIEAESDG